MTRVEILPWAHDYRNTNHEDVIAYLKSLSKGTVLALECPPILIKELKLWLALPPEKFKERIRKEKIMWKTKHSPFHAMLITFGEVWMASETSNTKVKLIETSESIRRQEGAVFGTSKEWVAAHEYRDRLFTKKVTEIVQSRPKKVVVLAGLAHASGIQRGLKMVGIHAPIRHAIFRDRGAIHFFLRINRLAQAAIKRKKWEVAHAQIKFGGKEVLKRTITNRRITPPVIYRAYVRRRKGLPH